MSGRDVERVISAVATHEGAGFLVHRPFPTPELEHIDPFLLLDEMGPMDLGPGEAKGAPDHPHRGFETVTYMLDGTMEHRDSSGNEGKIGPGDVQWMTAGGGVIHSEMPSETMMTSGGRMHGFQLWVNLPRKDKMMAPRYQEIVASRIPEVTSSDGRTRVRVIAGESMGTSAVIDTRTPIAYLHVSLQPDADFTQPIPADFTALLYVFEGEVSVGERELRRAELAILGPGDEIGLSTSAGGECLLIAGRALNEPIARYGPFVMNYHAEIRQAVADLQSGRFVRA